MDMDPELAREFIAAARGLQETQQLLLERLPHRRASDMLPASATAQAGNVAVEMRNSDVPRMMSVAVHSAVLCAVLSIITIIGGGMLYLNMKDHLDAIYMMAPQLTKPTGDKAHEHHHSDAEAEQSLDVVQ